MQIDIATLFPEMCDAVLQESILGRAQKSGAISVQCWNIRDYTPVSYTHLTLPTKLEV